MLPSLPNTAASASSQDVVPHAGEWWRLVDDEHELSRRPAPDHGLVLLVSEVRIIDGVEHTVVLHPHPRWGERPGRIKILIGDFLKAFAPAPNGGDLREAELDEVMQSINAITDEMRTPPSPAQLERQTEEESEASHPKADAHTPEEAPSDPHARQVPTALLPSEDIIEAQASAERRIAGLKAQQTWITEKTRDLQDRMQLIGRFQEERVATTLASIHEQTSQAQSLLENVQTMRLFLGEDIDVHHLVDGASAPASEPLTFLQRMLYLDEEIFIHGLLDGFNADHMEDLARILASDFALVERMLPHPRSVVLVKVRRNDRTLPSGDLDIHEILQSIQDKINDNRVHALVRDGRKVHIVIADEMTSAAERLFPSRVEIDALFQERSWGGQTVRAITPHDVEYSDARAAHDRRALFYKRFLIMFWGLQERLGVFGPFIDAGANWLEATVHDDRFRFVHDEENALADDTPKPKAFMAKANRAAGPGSRVVVQWSRALSPGRAPTICTWERDRVQMKNCELVEPISLVNLSTDKGSLRASVTCERWGRAGLTKFNAGVKLRRPARTFEGRPDLLAEFDDADGWICLDLINLAELDRIIESREARKSYIQWLHLFAEARRVLAVDQAYEDSLWASMLETHGNVGVDRVVFSRALRAWRAGAKWEHPHKDKDKDVIFRIAQTLFSDGGARKLFTAVEGFLWGGVKNNGDLYAVRAIQLPRLEDGTALPWLEELSFAGPQSRRPKKAVLTTWREVEPPTHIELLRSPAAVRAVFDALAPPLDIKVRALRGDEVRQVSGWRTPAGVFDARHAGTLEEMRTNAGAIDVFDQLLSDMSGDVAVEWLMSAFHAQKIVRDQVSIPQVEGSLGMAWCIDERHNPRAWMIGCKVNTETMALARGRREDLLSAYRRTYAHPERRLERIEAFSGSGIMPTFRPLGWRKGLKEVWIKQPCLSFDLMGEVLSGASKDWRERLVREETLPDVRSGHFASSFSEEAIRSRVERLNFVGPPGALELLERLCAGK